MVNNDNHYNNGNTDDLSDLRKKYMNYLLKYILFVSIGAAIIFIIYNTTYGEIWLRDKLYILIIFGVVAFILYIIPYFKYQRKLDG